MEVLQGKANVTRQRDLGIDVLRIVSASYVIIIHILGFGGILGNIQDGSLKQYAALFLYYWAFCAVNIFGIISGYAGYTDKDKPVNFRRYLMLWLEVVFYNVLITLVSYRLVPEYDGMRSLSVCFFPVSKRLHWYFTAYTALFPLMPLLNAGVRNCSDKTLFQLLAFILFVFAPLETFYAPFKCSWGGYSFVWVLLLYLIGAILKKTRICDRVSPAAALAAIAALNLLTVWIETHFDPATLVRNEVAITDQYVFLPHILCAIAHIPLSSRLKARKTVSKMITSAAAGSFAVYIINTQSFIWNYYMENRFMSWAWNSTPGMLVRVLAATAVFVAVSVTFDSLRRMLFRLVFRRR